jgi:hypothetical protein
MTAADLIRVLLELDQQVCHPRPSEWGKAAAIVHTLAAHAESSLPNPKILGDWKAIDLTSISRPAPRVLHQPTLDTIQSEVIP